MQANTPQPPSRSRSPASTWMACTTVVRGPSTSSSYSSLAGRYAVERLARVVLGLLFRHVHVQRGAPPVRPGHHRVHLVPRHRADRMDRGTRLGVRRDHPVLVVAEVGDPRRPPRGVAVAEAQLRAGQRQHPARFGPERGRRPGSRCRAASSAGRPRRPPGPAPGPSRWGRRRGARPAGGAGSGTPPRSSPRPAPSRRTRRGPAGGSCRGRAGPRPRTSARARSRTCRGPPG